MSTSRADLAFPYALDPRGYTATSPSYDAHVRDLIEQVLFTSPGERINRPDFGSGVMQLVFAPLGEELLASTRLLLQGNLQRFLGDLITVEALEVESEESRLNITLRYVVLATGQRRQDRFTR
ncbi:GPW/gp25 family protein [Archangium violaceum]|uniref:GPW/gp25 family protein n=1 Tax=Archangium violaceum TaxID=83451 RepID=UPI00193C6EE1|nr:GPW/gp25 family protein [Archangium violaceum]QRK06079.1 GPW/gp25 family protein [Archangium violaceum]